MWIMMMMMMTLQIRNPGSMGVVSCLSQGGLALRVLCFANILLDKYMFSNFLSDQRKFGRLYSYYTHGIGTQSFTGFSGYHSPTNTSLTPVPENVTSAAVIKDLLFLLEKRKAIAAYVMREIIGGNRREEIQLQDLGLSTDCEPEKIWAGDTEHGACVLHVLYTIKGHGHALASYTLKETFLKKCG